MNLKYKGKGHCWSQLIELCLQKNTLVIPENVIGDTDQQMRFKKSLMMHIESVLTRGPVRAGNINWSGFVTFCTFLTINIFQLFSLWKLVIVNHVSDKHSFKIPPPTQYSLPMWHSNMYNVHV